MKTLSGLLGLLWICSASAQVTQNFELYGVKDEKGIQAAKKWGFNQLILENAELVPVAETEGFRITLANWWSQEKDIPWGTIEKVTDSVKDSKSLVAVNMMDEPNMDAGRLVLHPPSLYKEIREHIRSRGNEVPLSLTLVGPHSFGREEDIRIFADYLESVDRLRIDPYPVMLEQPVSEVYKYIERARSIQAKKKRDLPMTVILQTWSHVKNRADGKPMLPSIHELRVMAYLALFSEVDTISFFDYNPEVWGQVPSFTQNFGTLMKELKGISTELKDAKVESFLGENLIFRSEITLNGKNVQCLEVNASNQINANLAPLQIIRAAGPCFRFGAE